MKRWSVTVACSIVLALASSFAPARARVPATNSTTLDDARREQITRTLGVAGSADGEVFVVRIPRTDLSLNFENGQVPIAAGIESVFYFFPCPCGKTNVIGQLCAVDYEANDVVDALRAAPALIRVTSIGPMLIGEKPRLTLIRFQGEGDADALAKSLKEALRWIGEERMKKQK